MQTNKYKVGEKVIISESVRNHEKANCIGAMNKWIGKVMTIKSIDSDGDYRMIEDVEENLGGYFWCEDMIQGLADSKLDRFAKGEIALHTPTQEIYDKLMQWCDRKGFTWNGNKKATKINVFCRGDFCIRKPSNRNQICWGVKSMYELDGIGFETLSLADFCEPEQTPGPLSITIEFNGRETVATLLKNGKPVKQAVAKCLPTDKFSEAVGSQLALARLFEKKQKEVFSDDPIDKFVKFLLAFGEHIEETKNKEKSQVKEVNRRAKVGEWIRYTRSDYSFPNDNRIFQVIEVSPFGVLVYFVSNEKKLSAFPSEYVVLEGYNHVQ